MVDEVLAGLGRLSALDPAPLSDGLHPDNARACLDAAISAITAQGLRTASAEAGVRPEEVTLIAAAGVFTSPIEWVALLLASGCRLRIKAPSRTPELCMALAECMAAEGLPVRADTQRSLGAPEAIIAFGGDASMAAIQAATPGARHSLYGHRFSIALVTADPQAAAQGLARDAALYDGRGCMAPTAVFTTGDPVALAHALAPAMEAAQAALPRGEVDPMLGPEWRRRTGLARVLGHCIETTDWAVPVLPAAHFHPIALPRMLPIHGVKTLDELARTLAPWSHQLSTCGTDTPDAAPTGSLRICQIGQMQTPAFPRDHDGRSMLGGILG